MLNQCLNLQIGLCAQVYKPAGSPDRRRRKLILMNKNNSSDSSVGETDVIEQIGIYHIFQESHDESGIVFLQTFVLENRDGRERA